MKKGFFILLTVCIIVLMLSVSAFAANPFTDVNEEDWFYDSVDNAYTSGLMIGISSTIFSPNSPTTRAMLVTVMWRGDAHPPYSTQSTFLDLTENWYRDAVHWAAENEIVYGYSPTRFGPNDNVTREQLFAIIYRYGEYHEVDLSSTDDLSAFLDADEVSPWALDVVKWAVGEGQMKGIGNDLLDPQGTATRAMLATLLNAPA